MEFSSSSKQQPTNLLSVFNYSNNIKCLLTQSPYVKEELGYVWKDKGKSYSASVIV